MNEIEVEGAALGRSLVSLVLLFPPSREETHFAAGCLFPFFPLCCLRSGLFLVCWHRPPCYLSTPLHPRRDSFCFCKLRCGETTFAFAHFFFSRFVVVAVVAVIIQALHAPGRPRAQTGSEYRESTHSTSNTKTPFACVYEATTSLDWSVEMYSLKCSFWSRFDAKSPVGNARSPR